MRPHLSRRAFLRTTLSFGVAVAIAPRVVAQDKPPNIVVILADDLGYGDVSFQNPGSRIPTPNMDRLAGEGIRFTDAHAPAAVCTPTRYGLLTGRYCWRSRLKKGVLWQWEPPLIEPGRLTVPAMLREHGYATACVGKWHLGWNWPFVGPKPAYSKETVGCDRVDWSQPITGGPLDVGFDYYFGDDVPNFPPYVFIEGERTLGTPTLPKPDDMYGHPGPMLEGWKLEAVMPALTEKAVAWIERAAQDAAKPFFLYFPLTAPHLPVVPAEAFKGRSRAGDYGDFVVEVDWAVGEVLDALGRNGLAENTLVIVTSDNGPENQAYTRIEECGHYSMGDLRGIKRDLWEGGHRVPFLARWPGHIAPGTVSDEVICLTDLMATAGAIVGHVLPDDAGEDSYNILPALLGQKKDGTIREATVHHSGRGRFAIRKGAWVFIDASSGDDNREPAWLKAQRGYAAHDLPGELYNLREDQVERRNVYGENADVVNELKALLEKYKRDGRSVPVRQ